MHSFEFAELVEDDKIAGRDLIQEAFAGDGDSARIEVARRAFMALRLNDG
jgi:hypothetical protein